MSRFAARLRTLTALLLLLLGQFGVALPAQAAACRRAALPATAQAAHAAADWRGHGAPTPDEAPASALGAAGCGAALALPEPACALPLPPARRAPLAVRGEQPPGRFFATPCFRPPRAS